MRMMQVRTHTEQKKGMRFMRVKYYIYYIYTRMNRRPFFSVLDEQNANQTTHTKNTPKKRARNQVVSPA